MWDIIHVLIEETKEANEKMGKSFDIGKSIMTQIPFFACKNILLYSECHTDISKYIYCKDFSISPYPGSYPEQPLRWVSKSFIIKNALVKRDNMMQQEHANKVNNG